MQEQCKHIVQVLLIEDDPMVQEVNRMFIEGVNGYKVIGTAGNGQDGLRMIEELKPDLIFLDVFMPSFDGISTLQEIRARDLPVDVIVVTAAKETETLRAMMRNGAVDYIIKPFKLERVRRTLERYRDRYETLTDDHTVTQEQLDRILQMGDEIRTDSTVNDGSSLLGQSVIQEKNVIESSPPAELFIPTEELPKGLNPVTLKQVLAVMADKGGKLSAEETAEGVGIARVTARRYLEYLSKIGYVYLEVNYGGVGRPINRYTLHSRPKRLK
ncbi:MULTISPECIES: response regulator [Paenibacillus]|uniref:response regulator n=1 Tax=Paenibacillus TaxID=44249 RepID=UPI0002890856|nr:response regulator [Paenibacillus alvei]EJW15087.1 putative C4-dicarboxylate response regulator DctR [Paenibacillus alvei DSM 29]MCY7484689.1 response regulator [Paenibacillus alvei]MCY9540865.1 response regulator [Paenibacillus alvei]MCY9705984.1 response regulator [Paenibacillus alvei]MEC0083827.1 response regulator [Paenibacillus alvei]